MRKFDKSRGKSGGRSSGRSSRGDSGGRSSGRSGGRSFNRRDSGRSSYGQPTMHEVTCDKCGQSCEVPFKPTGGKPVYCSDCFRKGEGSESGSRGRRQDFRSGSRRESRPRQDKPSAELQQINEKLDKILEILNED